MDFLAKKRGKRCIVPIHCITALDLFSLDCQLQCEVLIKGVVLIHLDLLTAGEEEKQGEKERKEREKEKARQAPRPGPFRTGCPTPWGRTKWPHPTGTPIGTIQ